MNSTRLKEQLLDKLSDLEAHKKGRDILLAFRGDVGEALAQVSQHNEAMVLAKAVNIIVDKFAKHVYSVL